MALTKVTGQVIKNTTDVTVGVLTVTNTLAVGGTVSIGGTLTYEDVTNVDAVGLITARNGIVVGSGITLSKDGDIFATGVTTATTFSGNFSGGTVSAVTGTFSDDITITGGTGRLTVSSSVDSVGIFTSTDGSATLDLFDNDTQTRIRTTDGRLHLSADHLNAVADSEVRFMVDGTNQAAIDGNAHFYFVNDPDTYFHHPEPNTLAFTTLDSERVRIESGGNIGIGTTDPNNLLHVYGGQIKAQTSTDDTNTDVDLIRAQCGSSGNALFSIRAKDAAKNNSHWDIKTNTNEDLSFTIGGSTERVRITNSGHVGIGTTMDGSGTRMLHVYKGSCGAHGRANGEFCVESNNAATVQLLNPSTTGGEIQFGDESNAAAGRIRYDHPNDEFQFKTDGNNLRLIIDNGGQIAIGHTASILSLQGPQTEIVRPVKTQIIGNNVTGASAAIICYRESATGSYYSPAFYLARSGSGTKGVNGVIPANTPMGTIVFSGDDGSKFVKGAKIQVDVDGTPGTDDMPAKMRFFTTPDGAAVPTEKFRISNDSIRVMLDNLKLTLGAGSDMELFHNGTNNVINSANGELILQRNGTTFLSYGDDAATYQAASGSYTLTVTGAEAGNANIQLRADDGDDNGDTWRLQCVASTNQFNIMNNLGGTQVSRLSLNTDGDCTVIGQMKPKNGTAASPGLSFSGNSDAGFHTPTDNNIHVSIDGTDRFKFNISHFSPTVDNAYDLGQASTRWDDVRATNGSIVTSDRNEKNTIVTSDLGLDFINKLSPVSYKFNNKTRTHYGLIAQDIETVLSEIGKSPTDFAGFCKDTIDSEGNEIDVEYGLRYNEFVSPMIKAIQDLHGEINVLKERLAKAGLW